jgi:hypothetical protein
MDTHPHPMRNDPVERRGHWLTGCIQFNMIHRSSFRVAMEKCGDTLRNCIGITVNDLGSSPSFPPLYIDDDWRAIAEVLPPGALDRRKDEQIILALMDISDWKRIALAAFPSPEYQQQQRPTYPLMQWRTQQQREDCIGHLHHERGSWGSSNLIISFSHKHFTS